MATNYEVIRYKQGLGARIVVHSVNRFKLHWHRELEILLVLKGQIQVHLNGKTYQLREDDLFLINSGEVHSTAGHGNNIIAAIQIDPEFCSRAFPQFPEIRFDFKNCILQDPKDLRTGYIRMLIAQMIQEYNKAGSGYQLVIEGLLNMLAAALVRNIPVFTDHKIAEAEQDREFSRIESILSYINTHYTDKITLDELAESVYLSSSYLSHFFRDKIGLSFQEYVTQVRLKNAVCQLEQTERFIGEIAMDCGFPSTKAFNKSFRECYEITPGEYRKMLNCRPEINADSGEYMEYDSMQAMNKLQQYLENETIPKALERPVEEIQKEVSTAAFAGTWKHSFDRIGAVGRAADLLRKDLQEQVMEAAKLLGFELFRFHGIFNDELRVVERCADGQLKFCWQYTDIILDFLTGHGIFPILDLTFMPKALASGNAEVFHYRGNMTPPKRMDEWCFFIDSFVRHCINRYGLLQVCGWYFEIWNEPDLVWRGTKEEYYELYDETSRTLKKIDVRLKVAGPSVIQMKERDGSSLLAGMVEHLNRTGSPLDCLTFHIYGEEEMVYSQNGGHLCLLGDSGFMSRATKDFLYEAQRLCVPVKEVLITEFNSSAVHGNYLLDTMFAACHMVYHALQIARLVDGVASWVLSDIFEEDEEIRSMPFSGGFGLLTAGGIRKPSWYAVWFLHQLGDEVVTEGEEYIVTRKGECYQILMVCYAHYDQMFRKGDRSALRYHERYEVFEARAALRLTLKLQELTGTFLAERYELNRCCGSAFELYEQMGAPKELTGGQGEWLRRMSAPKLTVETIQAKEGLTLTAEVPVHGICFMELKPLR